jgi:hypothetical protein
MKTYKIRRYYYHCAKCELYPFVVETLSVYLYCSNCFAELEDDKKTNLALLPDVARIRIYGDFVAVKKADVCQSGSGPLSPVGV